MLRFERFSRSCQDETASLNPFRRLFWFDAYARVTAISTKVQQAEATTRHLLDVAREAFTERGFAGTNVEAIAAAAGVTKGALYHHFSNKEALFRAVFLELQAEIGARIRKEDAVTPDPWEGLILGCRAFLAAAREPAVQRIVLQDAPSILGSDAWRAADEENSTYQLRDRLRHLSTLGYIGTIDPDMLTSMINGALNDAALLIADSSNPKRGLSLAYETLDALLKGVRSK